MNSNLPLSDRVVVAAAIDPDATAASTVTTSWVSVADFGSLLAIVMVGTLGSSATVDAKLEEATSAAGAGAQDLTGKAITQLTDAGSDDDKQALINVRADELSDTYTHVRLSITVATASCDIGGVLLGGDQRYEQRDSAGDPANDATTVDQVVV